MTAHWAFVTHGVMLAQILAFVLSTPFTLASPAVPGLPLPPILGFGINVPYYSDLLPEGGSLECLFPDNPSFGYLFRRRNSVVLIDMINKGELEGEKTRLVAEEKDYGTPLIHYLSVYKRYENSASYLEFLIEQKMSAFSGKYPGAVMYTEAFYEIVDGKEVETLKPLHKKTIQCTLKSPG